MSKSPKKAYQDLAACIWPQTSATQMAKMEELEKLEGPPYSDHEFEQKSGRIAVDNRLGLC